MGNKSNAPPINEAVFILNKLAPDSLEKMRIEFPNLAQELVLGRIGGKHELLNEDLYLEYAQVAIRALEEAIKNIEYQLPRARNRMIIAKKHRLWSQIISLVCNSGVLAAIAFDDKFASILTAVLALLASIGIIVAEHQERLLQQGNSNIYEAYEKSSQALYKAKLKRENIKFFIKHKIGPDELRSEIESANALCEELSDLIIQISGSDQN